MEEPSFRLEVISVGFVAAEHDIFEYIENTVEEKIHV